MVHDHHLGTIRKGTHQIGARVRTILAYEVAKGNRTLEESLFKHFLKIQSIFWVHQWHVAGKRDSVALSGSL